MKSGTSSIIPAHHRPGERRRRGHDRLPARTHHVRASIQCGVEEGEGKPVRLSRMLNNGYEPPSESGNTNWSEEALANASENSQAIAGWAFEMGLEMMSLVVAGLSSVLTTWHTSHQHLTLQLAGVPNHYLPEAHNISKKQLAELLPFMDEEELAHAHRNQVDAAAEGLDAHLCQDEDLMDEPASLSQRDPIIEGIINFKSSFELVGESNIGKSFFLLGQMACVAAGIPFAGAKVIKSHCFYFDAEGGSTTRTASRRSRTIWRRPVVAAHRRPASRGLGHDQQARAPRYHAIHPRKAGTDPVGIVAFDSLNQAVALRELPFDENSSSDMVLSPPRSSKS
ncbi:hypothetical protein GH714_044139 [Hevea brasiliensis]|uniref:Uncharacterized protein n=1 Tax=Hevea brasiliensis TaxID=3981 RepID=A0A6A6K1F9_HEVBR|nr:hypothetical protein GH714_044139 [Hevea brasiliensis]